MSKLEQRKRQARLAGAQAFAWSNRHRREVIAAAAVILMVIVVLLAVAIDLAAATFALVLCTTVFTAVMMLGWKPFEARPSLVVGLWVDAELVTTYKVPPVDPRPPIDVDACVLNAVSAVRREIPDPPPAIGTPSSLDLSRASLAIERLGGVAASLESRDTALARLNTELGEYESELRRWLKGYASRRWPRHAVIRQRIAIRNAGENVAERITLRIVLPDGVLPVTREKLKTLPLPPPPPPPKFEQLTALQIQEQRLQQGISTLPDPTSITAGHRPVQPNAGGATATSGPTFALDGDEIVAEVRLPSLTHGVTETSDRSLDIGPAKAGVYDLRWEAHVGNLRRPARGAIRIGVGAMPLEGEPLRTVEEVVACGDVPLEGEA